MTHRKFFAFVLVLTLHFCVNGQNLQQDGIKTIYIYRTTEDFFKGKKDSIMGPVDYDYGKVKYVDAKTGKKIKYHLLKDSAFFGFHIPGNFAPIYVSCKDEKNYGVYFGGNENFYMIVFTNMYMRTTYDASLYSTGAAITYDDFGYYCRFVKKGFDDAKKNGSIDAFIKDNEALYNKYKEEEKVTPASTWNKVFLNVQVKYLKKYNNVQ